MTGTLPARRLPLWLVSGVAAYFLVLKLVIVLAAQPQVDEAYYWLWGQHLQLSYVDHPAFHAWLQGAVTTLLGTSNFSLRALSVATSVLTLWLLYTWSRRLAPEAWRYAFALSVALFYASPLMLFFTTFAIHDRVMLLLVMAATHCFALVGVAWAGEHRLPLRPLYLGAVLLGLAVLSKFIGAMGGIGIALALLARADTRTLLRSPHLWLAAGLVVALQIPTLMWNLDHGMLTVAFHLGGATAVAPTALNWSGAIRVALEAVLLLSPFCVWGIVRFVVTRAGAGFGGMLHSLGRWIFLASTLAILLLEVVLNHSVLFYWNILAYGAFFGLAAWFMRSRLLILLQLFYGGALSTLLVVHFCFFPILDGRLGPQSGNLYGWDQLAAAVAAAEVETGAQFAASDNWQHASQLALAMHRVDLPAITATPDAFDQWFVPGTFDGKDAVLLAERHLDYLSSRFDSVSFLRNVEVTAGGVPVFKYKLYLGRGFHADPASGI